MAKKLVILDRDGVINKVRDEYVSSIEHFKFETNAVSALKKLISKRYSVCVCSNQQGVAKKIIDIKLLHSLENIVNKALKSDETDTNSKIKFLYCTHLAVENCLCRKPKAGLLEQALELENIKVADAIFVGDNITDYYAAQNIKMDFALVLTGHGLKFRSLLCGKVPIYSDLNEFVNHYIAKDGKTDNVD